MFHRRIKEDIEFINAVLRRYERLISENSKEIVELHERIDVYAKKEQETRCKCETKEK